MKIRKVIIAVVVLALVLLIVGGGVFYCIHKQGKGASSFTSKGFMGRMNASGEMITAYGVTSVGMIRESFEVEGLETQLDIEEVYVSSNQEVEEGTAILKLSEESVEEAREELETKLRETDLAYRAGAIEYEQKKITAEYDRDTALLNGEQAEEVYNQSIASLESSVERAKEELSQAQEDITEYQEALNGDPLYDYYKVEEYKSLYDENLKLLTDKMSQWGVSWSQVVTVGGASDMVGGSGLDMGTNSGSGGSLGMERSSGNISSVSGGDAGYVTCLRALYSVLEQNLSDYEKAQSDYEDAAANAEFELQTLELSLPSLEKALAEAQESYETRILEAKLTYEKAIANAKRAASDYEAAMEKAQSDYEALESAWEDAKSNLELFESRVGDSIYYAAYAGTILRTAVKRGDVLTSDSTVFIYSNPKEMTVSVSVGQADISKISVGDAAYIESGEYGSLEGVVAEINPVSASDSRTSVTYNVTVALTGDIGKLTSDETVTVIFGMGGNSK